LEASVVCLEADSQLSEVSVWKKWLAKMPCAILMCLGKPLETKCLLPL